MSETSGAVGKLDIGRVFGDGFGVVRRQIVPLGVATLVLAVLPTALNLSLNLTGDPANPYRLGPSYWGIGLVALVLGCLNYAFQFRIAVGDLAGDAPSWREALRTAVPRILPTIGLIILWALGVMLGWVLLLVPGLILITMWAVSLPALENEAIGPIKAFGRSRSLTKGNRWRVFGVLILLMIALFAFEAVILGVLSGVLGGRGEPGGAVIGALGSGVLILLVVGMLSALYVQLRSLKEGLGGASAAAVFD